MRLHPRVWLAVTRFMRQPSEPTAHHYVKGADIFSIFFVWGCQLDVNHSQPKLTVIQPLWTTINHCWPEWLEASFPMVNDQGPSSSSIAALGFTLPASSADLCYFPYLLPWNLPGPDSPQAFCGDEMCSWPFYCKWDTATYVYIYISGWSGWSVFLPPPTKWGAPPLQWSNLVKAPGEICWLLLCHHFLSSQL